MWPYPLQEIKTILNSDEYSIYSKNDDLLIHSICTDSRKFVEQSNLDPQTTLFVAIKGEKFDAHEYLKVVFDKGCPAALVCQHSSILNTLPTHYLSRCIRVKNVQDALRQFAAEFRKSFTFPVIAVGGSNGKTTTKEILASMLSYSNRKITKTQKSENGFLGVAFTLLQKAHHKSNPPDALVLEIGIDEIGAMQQHVNIAQPDVALLTALGPEHLLGLKTWENAVKEELVLFSGLSAMDPAVKPRDDKEPCHSREGGNPLAGSCDLTAGSRIWQLSDPKLLEYFISQLQNTNFVKSLSNDMFVIQTSSLKNNSDEFIYLLDFIQKNNLNSIFWQIESSTFNESAICIKNSNNILYQSSIPLSGVHNAQNFALAFATAYHLGHAPAQITEGFKNFTPPPQRSRFLHLPFDTVIFDDTYNASPLSMNAALDVLNAKEWTNKQKILVLGDMRELEEESNFWHEKLLGRLQELHNTHLCLFGPAMYNCYKLLEEARNSQHDLQETEVVLEWLDETAEPTLFLERIKPHLKGSVILVKGSRGLRLERFVQSVENFFS